MDEFKCEVPDGRSGRWAVETFEITEDQAKIENLRHSIRGMWWASVRPGTYKKLTVGGAVMMSNTPMELRTNSWIIREATGRVLINGLGLGCVLTAILKKPQEKEVWVVEKELDVINLVWPTFEENPRCKLIHYDAMTYSPPPGTKFDVVWHDIWIDICADNLVQMKKLHQRYGNRTKKQASWCRDEIEAQVRRYG